jgi:DNA-binding NtrC family response regulator
MVWKTKSRRSRPGAVGSRKPHPAALAATAGRVMMAVILIVEDDFFIRELAEMTIQEFGHQTFSAGDVDDALLLLRSPQHLDVLIADIRLRTAADGGFELARQAIKLRPNLRVLYTTGNSIADKRTALFVEGAHFLQKPYTQSQLQRSIEKLLAT